MQDHGFSLLRAGCEHVYTDDELRRKLVRSAAAGRPLRVKLGMDPTAPDIHLGHCVQLSKMRQFQDLGHTAVLIIGDFTAMIGDPTGRSKTRPVLTADEIRANARTYMEQAGRVLDMRPEKLEVRHNSEWLSKMDFADVVKLAAKMTVGQMLKREDFRNRFESETPISVHELLYPLVQGWDSVNIRADVELGGTDQTYNNLVGRDLQTDAAMEPQVVMILPLLRGVDGEKKMSKSLGNTIAVQDSPRDMFGRTMSIPDSLLEEWFRLLTSVPAAEAQALIREHPMKAKQRLAVKVGARFHGAPAMEEAAQWWRSKFDPRLRETESVPVRVPATEISEGTIPAWKLAWLAHDREISRSEARRMVEGGAFEFDGRKITDPNEALPARDGAPFRAGRHRKGERVKQPLAATLALDPA
ncbi:MAG: tyrosine--tRNA ligase [Phycisphaerales bacterium]|nr:tyrosine--tRNA ligase [Phycisphaerales bacterium]